MSRDKVVDIGQAVKDVKSELPSDMAKMAVWRKGLPSPITFVVEESVGRDLQERYTSAVSNGTVGTIAFDTYNDGSGRRNHTVLDVEDIVGLTLEYSSIRLASA